jgi:hypothetical protein
MGVLLLMPSLSGAEHGGRPVAALVLGAGVETFETWFDPPGARCRFQIT